MPLFTLHRNHVLRTTKGHTISFKKNKETHVPTSVIPDAVAIGAVPLDDEVDVLGAEEEAQPALSTAERKETIFKAFLVMKTRAERLDFNASGVPNGKRLAFLTRLEISSKERDALWMEYRTGMQEEVEQTNLDVRVEEAEKADADAQEEKEVAALMAAEDAQKKAKAKTRVQAAKAAAAAAAAA
jgi:hypothetical protein